MKPSLLLTLGAGLATVLALLLVERATAQKADSVSPNQPLVTLCHKGITIRVAQSAVAAHLAHGDTLGPCPPAGK